MGIEFLGADREDIITHGKPALSVLQLTIKISMKMFSLLFPARLSTGLGGSCGAF